MKNNRINWVKVSDKMPPENERVLGWNGYRMIHTSWQAFTGQNELWFRENFTHWTDCVRPPSREVKDKSDNKAILVYCSYLLRIIVPSKTDISNNNSTEDMALIRKTAGKKLQFILTHDGGVAYENIEEIIDDLEVPYEPK